MSNIDKQWLQKKIAEMEDHRDLFPGELDDDHASVLSAFRIALASLEAEAVAWMWEIYGGGYMYAKLKPAFLDATPLYTAPPAPVSVPEDEQCKPHPVMAVKGELGFLDHFDRIISERDEDIDIGQLGSSNYEALMLAALDAFRAAMPHGTGGNSQWVACSERMPEQFVEVLVCTGDGGRYVAALNQSMTWDDGDFFDDIQYVTHWMPLPAAPKQEGKS